MESIRSFIAIEIPTSIKNLLYNLEEKLRNLPCNVKWVKPENIHLTLHFLGNLEIRKIEEIKEMIGKICKKFNPFSIEIDNNLGAFPNERNPRVIWLGIKEEKDILENLYQEIGKNLEKIKIETEKRKFHPHLTIGRVKSSKNKHLLTKAIREIKLDSSYAFEVKEVNLFKSTLTPQGSIYEKLGNYSLG
jgi:2'-5' RNA ligase